MNVFTNPLPFCATQIINPFLTSRLSTNHDKGLDLKKIEESLYSLMFLQCRIVFTLKDPNHCFVPRNYVTIFSPPLTLLISNSILLSLFPFLLHQKSLVEKKKNALNCVLCAVYKFRKNNN